MTCIPSSVPCLQILPQAEGASASLTGSAVKGKASAGTEVKSESSPEKPQPALASLMDAATAVTLGDDPASHPPSALGTPSSAVKPEAASQSPAAGSACKPGNASPAPTAPPAQPASPAMTPSVQAASDADKQLGTNGAAGVAAAVTDGPAAIEEDATGQAAAASSTAAAAAASTVQPMEQASLGKAAGPAAVKQEDDARIEESDMAADDKAAADMPAALVRIASVRDMTPVGFDEHSASSKPAIPGLLVKAASHAALTL